MTPDDPTPDDPAPDIDDERADLVDLVASLRADGVEPDASLLRRAEDLGIGDDEIELRATTMAEVRASLAGLSDQEATALAADDLSARRSVQRAIESGSPEPAVRRARSAGRRGRRVPSSVVAVAAATVIVAGVGIGGWLVAQDSSEQLASVDTGDALDAGSDAGAAGESGGPVPALPPDVPVIGAASTPDGAIDLAEQHWTTARTSSTGEALGGFDGDADDVDGEPSTEEAPAPAAGADELGERCGIGDDASHIVIVVIDESPHLVARDPAGAVVVLRLVDCREVARA